MTLAWLAALLGWTVVVSFFQLRGGAAFEPIDVWVAQTAREMSESPDWRGYVVPHFSGEVRMQKSPGAYWAVCLTAWLRGTPVDEVSARIPNAISAVLLVATLFWLTLRIAGERAAIFAGFAAASSVALLYWSHRGASDLGTTMFMSLSLACLWIGSDCEPPGRKRIALWLLGYFTAGLGMLYKQPMPLVCVGLPVLVYVLAFRRWSLFRSGWHVAGLLLFLLPWLPWQIALWSLQESGQGTAASSGFVATLQKWRVEYWDRLTGDLPNVEGQASDWRLYLLYIGVAFVFTVPWCLSIPQAIARAFRQQPGVDRRGTAFLLLWFFSLFVFFTATPGKETRYFLPAIPPLLCLLGIELSNFFAAGRAARPARDRFAFWLIATLVTAGLAGGAFIFFWLNRKLGPYAVFSWAEFWPLYLVTALLFGGGAILAAWLYRRQRGGASFATLVGTMWLTWLWVWPTVMPLIMGQQPFIDFAVQLRDRVPPELRPAIRQVAQQDPRVIWYSDVRFPRVIDQLRLLEMQGGQRDRNTEQRLIAGKMIELLRSDKPALFVIEPENYVRFAVAAPLELARRGEQMPPAHIWLIGRVGRPDHRYILFGNRPPPWNPPEFEIPPKLAERVRRQWEAENHAAEAEAPTPDAG